jgi:phospholipase C
MVAALAAAAMLLGVAPGAQNQTQLVRTRIKHVFIIYQENESFDHYFGSYPGADNLATVSAALHGFRQYDPLARNWIRPFRITDPDVESPDHSRAALLSKMNGGENDRYVAVQEQSSAKDGYGAGDSRRLGQLTMSYYDCDTIPYLWKYAHAFTLWDHFYQAMTGPSTPGNIEVIAAQSGQTQAARTPSEIVVGSGSGAGVPVENSMDPPFGPYPGAPKAHLQIVQRYATVMLTLNGRDDKDATRDVDGVREDLRYVAQRGSAAVPWGWYQEGYNGPNAAALAGYSAHHNALQYFAYLRRNGVFWDHVHPLKDVLSALRRGTLPDRGAFYIKGSNLNRFGWRPANRSRFIQRNFLGDDDHPGAGDSDRQVGEAFVATFVNAIARSRYWNDSAIIITWDDSGGFYDHAPAPAFERCWDGKPCGDGPRVPLILISPYARSGAVVHDLGDTTSVVRFIEAVFDLPPLARLPDEAPYMPLGPRDTNARLSNLLSAFDAQRLLGARAPIPRTAAVIPNQVVNSFPARMNCRTLHVHPAAVRGAQAPPPGFRGLPDRYIP